MSTNGGRSPAVSVVIAAYNRSNVLGYAIESVLGQMVDDWELIVVDDASTDDTRGVVDGFGDDRIRYVRLGDNFGDQSGPNNVGMLLAAGETVAFLNQDDLWLPEHLATGLAVLERTEADLVFAGAAEARSRSLAQLEAGAWSFRTVGRGRAGRYRPGDQVPATSWLFRRELVARVGMWRPAKQLYASSSADWLFRAHRGGARLFATGTVSVLVFGSGGRPGVYARRGGEENAFFAAALRDRPDLSMDVRRSIVDELPPSPQATAAEARNLRLARRLRATRDRLIDRTLAICGLSPLEVRFGVRFHGRGRFIGELRRTRGLDP